MAGSVSLEYRSQFKVTETLDSAVVEGAAAASRAVVHDSWNDAVATFNGSSSPAVTTCAVFEKDMSGGTAQIDFTALPATGAVAATFSASGLKLKFLKIINPSANNIRVQDDPDGDGYIPVGSDNFDLNIPAGGEITCYFGDNAVAVGASTKYWQMDGTTTQKLQFMMVFGS